MIFSLVSTFFVGGDYLNELYTNLNRFLKDHRTTYQKQKHRGAIGLNYQ